MKRLLGLSLAALFFAVTLQAQMPANFERGFAPEKLYQFGGLDHVNLFNGNLVITLPMGDAYPIGGGSSFQLTLTYNSSIWEYMEVSPITQVSKPNEPWGYPTRRSNAGLGWMLSVGRIFNDTGSNSFPGTSYESPDGNDHRIVAVANPTPNVTVTQDSSYLRWHTDTLKLDTPDGATRSFYLDTTLKAKNGYGWLSRMEDPFQNFVQVDQFFNAPGGLLSEWRITDNVGRTHHVYFKAFSGTTSIPVTAQTNYKTVVDRVELQTAGGTAVYQFNYANNDGVADQPTAVSEGCGGGAEGWPHSYNLPILRSVTLPNGSSYQMDYKTGTHTLESCDPGQIVGLTLPTLGKIFWRYGSYLFPIQSCSDSLWMSGTNGIVERKFTDEKEVDRGTWTYAQNFLHELTSGCSLGDTGRSRQHPFPQEITTTVLAPGGRKDVNHFSVYTGDVDYPSGYTDPRLSKWEYGSPQCRITRDATQKRGLSVETFDCSSDPCAAQPIRKKYIRYVFDGTTLDASGKVAEDASHEPLITNDYNPRTDSTQTLYDNGGSSADATKYVDEDQSDFDGFGHYRTTATQSSIDSIGTRTTYTNYNPGTNAQGFLNGSYKFGSTDAWVLGTYDSSYVSTGNHKAATEACFNAATGFLERTRTLGGDAAPPASVAEAATDLVTVYEHVNGNVTKEKYYGGDTQQVGTDPLCGLTLPAAPAYELRHGYSNGVRATTQYYSAGVPISFLSLDRTVHLSGTVTAERDTAGFATTYTYYPWGGLKTATPPGELPVTYTYANASADAAHVLTPASVTATRGDEERVHLYDALGRPFRETVLMPDGTRSTSETTYDIVGRKATVSGFENLAVPAMANALDYHPAHTTQYTYDILDRPTKIVAPDTKETTLSYVGIASTRRTVSLATGPAETSVTTAENYDRLGRLISVQEARGTTSSMITSYGYDLNGHLTSVNMPNGTGNQARTFTYDNRGFLLSETHPELGATGNGTVSYEEYDARGHAHRKIVGARLGAFDVRTSFDAAERPEVISRATSETALATDPVLKQFAYDQGYDCGTGAKCQGKLAAALRNNYSPGLGTIAVTESYVYDGIGGRPSRRYRTVGAAASFAGGRFFFDETYDDHGRPATITYPCQAQSNTCSGSAPSRQVSYQYTSGFLTSVAPWASALTYQPNGVIDTVTHGSSTIREVWTPDAYGLPRPDTITAVDANNVTRWTSGQYLFDGVGNIKKIGTRAYSYDYFNRLVAETDGGLNTTYAYDPVGNLKKQTTTIIAAPLPGTIGDGSFTRAINQIDVNSATNRVLNETYDVAGNALTFGGNTLTYDALGTTTSITAGSRNFQFLYTPDDERIAAVELRAGGNRTTWTLRGFDDQLLRTWRDDTSAGTAVQWTEDEIRRGSLLLASETPNGTRHYVLDHLGSPRLISDWTGLHLQNFASFGAGGSADGGSLQFTGHERDAASIGDGTADLPDYMHARFFSANAGRFLSVDPGPTNLRIPQTFNRYAYVRNAPIQYFDPDGRYPCTVSYAGIDGGKPFQSDCTDVISRYDRDVAEWNATNRQLDREQLQRMKFQMYRDPVFTRDPTLNLHMNVRIAQSHRDDNGVLKLAWFYLMERNKAPWDYKQLGRRYAKFGNFHYGLMGAAAGIPKDVLLRAAGFAQQRAGTSLPEWGIPFGPAGMSYTYGDDPEDQIYVTLGYNAYSEDFAPKP